MEEQQIAQIALETLTSKSHTSLNEPSVPFETSQGPINLPTRAYNLLIEILSAMSLGEEVSLQILRKELTTQQAADFIGCSRPHLVKLLDKGRIEYFKVGKHRRLYLKNVLSYIEEEKQKHKSYLAQLMKADEEDGLYEN